MSIPRSEMMDRIETWRMFVAVAESLSFAKAARQLGRSPQAVTRAVAALEDRLATRLLNRTTRSVMLTEAGARPLALCRHLLAEFEALGAGATGDEAHPRGALSVTASQVFGRLHVLPIVTEFLRHYPDVDVRLLLLDRVVSLTEEGLDLGVRIGLLPDSSLRATLVGHVRRSLYASPAYLTAEGVPQTPADLEHHACIAFTGTTPVPERWTFPARKGGTITVPVRPRLTVNGAEAAGEGAVAGLGLVRLLSYQVSEHLAAGRLVPVLREYEPEPLPIHLVHAAGHYPSAAMRLFISRGSTALRAKFKAGDAAV